MKRNQFLNQLEEQIQLQKNMWLNQHGELVIHTYSKETISDERAQQKNIELVLKSIGIQENIILGSKHTSPDWLLMEDEDSDCWIYTTIINPNQIYDCLQRTNSKSLTLYRLEHEKNADGIFGIANLNGIGNQISPYEDPQISKIFKSPIQSNKYHLNWKFACLSKEELMEWIGDYSIEKLEKSNIIIAEIKIPEEQVIIGHKQCIFNSNHVLSTNYFPLVKKLDNNFKKTKTPKML